MSIASVLTIIAPQFNGRADRNDYINFATLQVNQTTFGDKYDLAGAYMAAHMMTLNPETGQGTSNTGSGFITSKKEGDLAMSYAQPKSNSSGGGDAILSQTSYGQQFIGLRDSCTLSLGVTGRNEFIS